MQTEKLVPKLRFKEFEGVWEEKNLWEISVFYNNTRVPLSTSERNKIEKIYPYYWATWIIDEVDNYLFDWEYILLWEDGANIITRSVRMAFLVKWKFRVNNHAHVLQAKNGLNKFLCEILERIKYDKYNTWTAQPKLNSTICKGIKIVLPKVEEQKKIATFLTLVDTKIQQLESLKSSRGEYKKWVMQKIFSQEIRFKDENGEEFGEWENTTLWSLCSIATWKLDANAMVEWWEYRFYTCAKNYCHIDNYAFDTDALLISGNWANVWYIHHYNWKFNAYQRTYVLDWFWENISYVRIYLDMYLRKRILWEKNEWNMPYIVLGTLRDMKINLPTLVEQNQIVDIIHNLDSCISWINKKLLNAKQRKKWLLQLMFV
jgi:type I restriction enzyme S subunit